MNRILILIALLIHSVYFVGATRNNYKTVIIDGSDLCLPVMSSMIILRESQPGMLVTQLNLREHRMHCHFVVDVEKLYWRHFGVYAVIQNLNFRYDAVNEECIDYIKFTGRSGDWTERICGTHNTTKQEFLARSISDVGSVAPKGNMNVIIHIDKESSAPNKGQTDMSIAFTLFENGYGCQNSYSRCGEENECVLSDLFGDGIVNCPYLSFNDEWTPDDRFITMAPRFTADSTDKKSSDLQTPSVHKYVRSALKIAAFLLILVPVLCKFVCQKCGQSLQEESPVADVEKMDALLIATAEPCTPPSNDDKDLPPPYDTINIV